MKNLVSGGNKKLNELPKFESFVVKTPKSSCYVTASHRDINIKTESEDVDFDTMISEMLSGERDLPYATLVDVMEGIYKLVEERNQYVDYFQFAYEESDYDVSRRFVCEMTNSIWDWTEEMVFVQMLFTDSGLLFFNPWSGYEKMTADNYQNAIRIQLREHPYYGTWNADDYDAVLRRALYGELIYFDE